MTSNLSCVSVVGVAAMFAVAGSLTIRLDAAQQSGNQRQQPAATANATKVDLDDLEDHPEKYVGQTLTVEGEVDRILGPHLFTIDEPDWVDPAREMPVLVPEPFTAIVRSDAPVLVTGVVKKVPIADIERHGSINDAKVEAKIKAEPVLVANEVTTVAPAAVSLRVRTDRPVGTSGTSAETTLKDANQLASASDTALVGRPVDVSGAVATGVTDQGFWIRTPTGERIWVMTENGKVKEGQTVGVQGVVLELPEGVRVAMTAKGEPIYIYAERVTAR